MDRATGEQTFGYILIMASKKINSLLSKFLRLFYRLKLVQDVEINILVTTMDCEIR